MNTGLTRFSAGLFALMRLVVGVLFACHGAQKLFGAFGSQPMTGKPLMLVAGIIEFGGGLLIAIGLLARVAALFAAGEMAVAYFMVHAPQGFWPILNKGELALVYCFVFLFIASVGAGTISVDSALHRTRPTAASGART